MDSRLDEIQQAYIADLRAVMPDLESWWARNVEVDVRKGHPSGIRIGFDLRWPADLAGHPRVLAIFRKYFLEVEKLNAESYDKVISDDDSESESLWGDGSEPEAIAQVLPSDLLIHDLEDDAPDLFEVMSGLVFVPICDDD
jgi:hypothetical protein